MRRALLAAASAVFVDVIMKDLAFLMSCPAALPGFSEAEVLESPVCVQKDVSLRLLHSDGTGCSPLGR